MSKTSRVELPSTLCC